VIGSMRPLPYRPVSHQRGTACHLRAFDPHTHPAGMFVVTEAEATAIRIAFDQGGEFAAAAELRRLFPAVTDNTQARDCARTIAAWGPLPVKPRRVRPPGKRR
jgi:hypothetical protein